MTGIRRADSGTGFALLAGVNLLALVTVLTGLAVSTPSPIPAPASATVSDATIDLVVEKQAAGPSAARLFFAEVEAHLEDGYALVGLGQTEDGLELVLTGAETVRVRAVVESGGHVVAVEVASGPRSSMSAAMGHGVVVPVGLGELGFEAAVGIDLASDGPALSIRTAMGEVISLGLGMALADEVCAG